MNNTKENLFFVTGAKTKFLDYQFLLGNYVNLEWLRQNLVDVVTPRLSILVRHKVVKAKEHLPFLPFIVEQTNLLINSWHNLPGNVTGIFIDRMGVDGICQMLQSFEDKQATVVTDLAYYDGKGDISVFRGEINGRIAHEPKGNKNYGWDCIFIPEGSDKTFAEMSLKERNKNSSRRKVVTQFAETIFHQENVEKALENKVQVQQKMLSNFNKLELQSLCFSLGIDQDELIQDNKSRFVEEIILYSVRRGTHQKLLEKLRELRPHVLWPNFE